MFGSLSQNCGAGEPALWPSRIERGVGDRADLGAADLHVCGLLGNPAGCAGENAPGLQVVDVREPVEFVGPLGHIRGARLIPLAELPKRNNDLSRVRPLVMVCRSGARSAQAVVLLQEAGFVDVANLAGGMIRWRADGRPVEGARV